MQGESSQFKDKANCSYNIRHHYDILEPAQEIQHSQKQQC